MTPEASRRNRRPEVGSHRPWPALRIVSRTMPSWTQLEDRHPLSGIANEALKCPSTKPKRVLEPVERISEFLFGLIMVLVLTCTFNVRGANRGSVRTMMMGALGCDVGKRHSEAVLTTWCPCLGVWLPPRPSRVARPARSANGLIGLALAFAR